jgi:hypothetical protein
MDPNSLSVIQGAAGAAGAAGDDKVYVEDVFSTYLYVGNSNTKTITNGIDLSGEGGLVWIKERNIGSQQWYDTERGRNSGYLSSHNYNAEYDMSSYSTQGLTSFNSDGFSLGNDWNDENPSGQPLTSWTFRKAPGFFDIVTYTGTGSNQDVPHSLGSVPGMVIVKCTSHAADWKVLHRSLSHENNGYPYTASIKLNSDDDYDPEWSVNYKHWGVSNPTSTTFRVKNDISVNELNKTYVAYLFAHDDQQFGAGGNESIIKCGGYTGTGSSTVLNEIDCGFEPQWVLIKNITDDNAIGTPWVVFDNMRGHGAYLKPNSNDAESTTNRFKFTSNGFSLSHAASEWNTTDDLFIYVAIRRGPMKTPEDATEVFAMDTFDGTPLPTYYSGFPVDFYIRKETNTTGLFPFNTRILGNTKLSLPEKWTEATDTGAGFDHNDGVRHQTGTLTAWQAWMFQRAPGFFDAVAYEGTGSAKTVSHNLGVAPEFIISTIRSDSGYDWVCWHSGLSTNNTYIQLNLGTSENSNSDPWNDTAPTATQFSLSDWENNHNNESYIAWLFATCPGVSKVGTYTGNGGAGNALVSVDCGFTAGARFVLIKRTDADGDWYVFDTTRGINYGDDPYLLLNEDDAEVTTEDYVKPWNSGFYVLPDGGNSPINTTGNYIYLAIA